MRAPSWDSPESTNQKIPQNKHGFSADQPTKKEQVPAVAPSGSVIAPAAAGRKKEIKMLIGWGGTSRVVFWGTGSGNLTF